MKWNVWRGIGLFVVAGILGCRETKSSEYIHTREIIELTQVVAEASDKALVSVSLRTDGVNGTYVELAPGDTLEVSAGALTKELKAISSGTYQATLGTGAGVDFTVDLDRAEEPDAPQSFGTLPMPFEITAPAADDVVSRASDDLVVRWDTMEDVAGALHITGPCIAEYSAELDGLAGAFTLGMGELTSTDPQQPGSCVVDLEVSFSRVGQPDPMLNPDSTFQGTQVRKVTIQSEP